MLSTNYILHHLNFGCKEALTNTPDSATFYQMLLNTATHHR